MHSLATMKFPLDGVMKFGLACDGRSQGDLRYALRCVLSESLGPDCVRPWRIDWTEEATNEVQIKGWCRKQIDGSVASRRFGAQIRIDAYDLPATGEVEVFSAHVSGTMRQAEPDGRRQKRTVDVATHERFREALFEGGREAAYEAWLTREMDGPRTGIELLETPTIQDCSIITAEVSRPNEVRPQPIIGRIPSVEAILVAKVKDRGTLGSFLLSGFRNIKHLGFGTLIPAHLCGVAA